MMLAICLYMIGPGFVLMRHFCIVAAELFEKVPRLLFQHVTHDLKSRVDLDQQIFI